MDDFKIPALDRGLSVLSFLVHEKRSARFIELKALFPGITDATLNRLLKALIGSGYLVKGDDGKYGISDLLRSWSVDLVEGGFSLKQMAGGIVERLSREAKESAVMVWYQDGAMVTIARRSHFDSISVIGVGDVIHYERDHAAALAVLDMMSKKERREAIRSELSEITSVKELEQAIKETKRDGYFVDRSQKRPGVCRVAVPIEIEKGRGCLFLGMTVERCKLDEARLGAMVKRYGAMMR